MSTESKKANAEKSIKDIVLKSKRELLGNIIVYNKEALDEVQKFLCVLSEVEQSFYWHNILCMIAWDLKTLNEFTDEYGSDPDIDFVESIAVAKRLRDMLGIDKPSFIPFSD